MGRALHIMTDQVTFAERTGTARSGDPTYGTQQAIACRHERKNNRVLTPAGEVEISNDVLASETEIPYGARVWLPGTDVTVDNASLEPKFLGRTSTPDGFGVFRTFL